MNEFNMTTSNNKWLLSYDVDHSGNQEVLLNTAGTFVDKNIHVNIYTPPGSCNVSATHTTAGVVTPILNLDSNANTYGITQYIPGGNSNYLTLDPDATVTNSTFTATYVLTAGYVNDLTRSVGTTGPAATIGAGQSYYMPIVETSFSGGTLSGSPTNVITPSSTIATSNTATSYYIDARAQGTVSRAAVTYTNAAGAIEAHTNESALLVENLSIDSSASRIYIPAASCSVTGGALGVPADGFSQTIALTLGAGAAADSNATNYSVGSKNTSTYPYYIKVVGSTPAVNGNVNVSVSAIKDQHTAGYLPAQNATTVKAEQSASIPVSVSATSNNTFVNLKQATATVTGTNNAIATLADSDVTGTNLYFITNNTDSGVSITMTAKADAGANVTASTNAPGYSGPANTQLGTATLTATQATATLTKKIRAVNVPASKSFTVTNSGSLTVSNSGTAAVSNLANSTTHIVSGTAGSSIGIITSDQSTEQVVVSNGQWAAQTITPSASEQGPFYGAITVAPMGNSSNTATVTTGYSNNGLSTYFNAGTNSDNNVVIEPYYTNTAGYLAAHSSATSNGGKEYWKIKTTSITQGTTTVSGTTATRGTATWGTGWVTTNSIGAATFSNTASSGVTYVDISGTTSAPVLVSGNYLYINKGYTDNLKISLAKLVPDGATANLAAEYILSGYSAYNNDGVLVAGNIPSKGSNDITFNGKTVQVPAGYYSSLTTADMDLATIKSGSATISSANFAYNSSNSNFNITGSANVSAPTVSTAGYISSSEGTKQTNSGGAQLAATVNKIGIKATISGTGVVTPTIEKITDNSDSKNITNVLGTASTTKPNDYYVAVQSNESKNSLTATPTVTSAGYGTTTSGQYTATNGTLIAGAAASAVTYLSIQSAALTSSATNVSANTVVAPGTVSIAADTTAVTSKTRIAITPQTSNSFSTAYYIAAKATAAANTTGAKSNITGTANAGVSTPGYAPTTLTKATSFTASNAATATTSAKDSNVHYFPIPAAAGSFGATTKSGSVTATIDNTNSMNTISSLTNKTAGVDYWQVQATATGSATYTPKYTVSTAGWVPTGDINGSSTSISVTADSTGQSIYIPKAVLSFNGGGVSGSVESSFTGITYATSDDYNNGLKIDSTGKASRNAVTYTNDGGYLPDIATAVTASAAVTDQNLTSASYYLKGVTLTTPSSGIRQFDITVPNGNETITFHFKVDSSGNVYVD